MLDRQFKAIAFRGEGKDIEAHVVDCVLAEDCAALIQRAREEERELLYQGLSARWTRNGYLHKEKIEDEFRAAGLREGEKP